MMKKALPLYLFVSAFMLMSTIVMGQLSGTYTIDGSSTTGGTNYQTFTAAVSALSSNGVSGAVTFNVAAGTYTEQVSIPAISGASTTNTITFKGLGTSTTLTAAPTTTNRPVLSLDSASHITIEDLKIEVTGTTGWGIHFMRHADTNTVTGCHIEGPVASGIYGIIGSGSISAISVVQNNGEYLTITNNTIEGCDRSIQFIGKTGPLTTPSKQINYGTDLNISNNTFTNFRGKAVIANHYHNVTVEGNTASTSSTNCNGALSFWDAGDNVFVSKNNLYVSSNTNNTRMIVLAMAPGNGPAGDSTQPGIVANNMIQYDGTNSTTPTGLLLKNKDQIKIYHNTFRMNNQGSNANCIWLDNNNARSLYGIEIRNNIMVLENAGSGQFIYTANSTLAARFDDLEVDHNNYFAPSGYFKSLVSNGTNLSTFNTFAAYKANTYGWATGALNVDPQFLSPTDLHVKAAAMNDSGAVISSITTDIDGQTRSTTNPDMGADEYVPPSCVAPTGLGVYNLLANSADVYWTQSNSGSTYKLQYGTTGFTIGTGTSMVPTNDTISLSGLTAQTTYDVYIKEFCSATDSSTWVSYSFTTGCGITNTYPYSEPFEGSNWVSGTGTTNSGYVFDPCWTGTSSGSYQWGTRSGSTSSSTTGPTNGFGGSGKYVFTEGSSGSTGDKANFITPEYDLSPLTVPQLSFHYHMYGADMGTFEVWAWNGTTYDTLMTISGDQSNNWVEAIVDLSPYQNDTTHLVFHAVRGSGYRSDLAIDSIIIDEAPPCPKPGVVTFDSITATSVNLIFSSPGHDFNVEFGPTGFSQGTGTTTTITGSGDTITGLTPNTTYDFYVANNCTDSSNGFSAWVGPFTVRTECSYTNSYFTNWDYLANTQTDNCWTFSVFGGGSPYARAYDPGATIALQPYSGNIYYRIYNSSSTESYFISPEITDLTTNTLQVRFQGSDSYTGSTGAPEFYVGTMLSVGDTASFTPLDTVTTITNAWTEFTVVLNNIPANHKHVVIRHAHNTNNVYMAIDDLYIEVQPACAAPSLGLFSDIRDTSAVLNWTAGDGSTFDIEYGTVGFIQGFGTTISGLTSTVDTLTGLMPDTCYDVYIRGNCTSNNSPWYGPISVCTECATKVAPFVEDFEGANWTIGYSTGNEVDDCWIRTPESASYYRWQTNSGSTQSTLTGPSSGAGGSGKYIYTEASRGSNNDLAFLEMPKADFSGLTTAGLSFSYHMYGSHMNELYVLIDDGTQTDTIWSISGAQQLADTSSWITAYANIDAYKSQPATISFVGKRGSSINGDIAIDNVGIDELPNCLTPNTFVLDSVFTTFADFSWASPSNGTSFKLEYGPTGFRQASATGTTVYTSSSPTRVSGLSAGMTYDIYLTDLCDSTTWVGPITFTTIIQNDAELESIISPFSLACGDSSLVVEVKVKNNGLNAITTLPVGANISGAVTSSISNTFSGIIAPGASATITLGTINTYMGGVINVDAYAGLSGDQDLTNDTLSETGLELISAVPLHMPVDSVCANDTAGIFVAIPQTGISHNWYANANDVTPIATGDTIGVQPGQTLYLDRAQSNSLVVQTGTAGSLFGTMFKIYVKQDFVFSGYSWVSHQSGTKSLKAFYKMGNYRGHETTRSSWTLIDSLEQTGTTSFGNYRFDFATPVTFTAGDTISIYLASKSGKYEAEGLAGATIDSVFKITNDFEYIAGVGGAYFGSNMTTASSASSIAKTLHWESLDVCGNSRIALTMGVNNDTAVASFTSVLNANGADVDFDASASSGHVYDWDFGDGNTGSGVNATNTYTAGGTYTVTLVVTDTVCGTTDTITQTVMPTVSLKELAFAGSVEVYPNPNSGKFNVDLNLIGGQDVQLALINTVGQIIYRKDLGNIGGHVETDMDIENLAPGVYYLRVIGNGKTTTVRVTIL